MKKLVITLFQIKINFIYMLKRSKVVINNFLCLKKVNLSNSVKFNQRTIFTGSGRINIGSNVVFGYKLGGNYRHGLIEIQARSSNSNIFIGDNVAFNNSCFIVSLNQIEIRKNTRIGANVSIFDFEAHGTQPSERQNVGRIGQVVIEENVWIGNNVIILKDTVIGKNSIISAGSVVFRGEYPENAIIGGNPAKVIKMINVSP